MRKLKRDLSLLLSFVFIIVLVQIPMTAILEAKTMKRSMLKLDIIDQMQIMMDGIYGYGKKIKRGKVQKHAVSRGLIPKQ